MNFIKKGQEKKKGYTIVTREKFKYCPLSSQRKSKF